MNGTYAKGEVCVCRASETRILNHCFEFILSGELPDALHQVLIWLPLTSQNLSHRGNYFKRIFIVQPERKLMIYQFLGFN